MNNQVTTNQSEDNQIKNKLTILTQLIHQYSKNLTILLPKHIDVKSFSRIVVTSIQNNLFILKCEPNSIVQACLFCAHDGLEIDGREAALVPFWDNQERKFKAQYIPMYQGLMKRIRNSNFINVIEAHIIYENDTFVWQQGSDPKLVHEPCFPQPRGNMIGVYAIAFYKNSKEAQFVVLSKDEIDKVKDSTAKGKERKINSVWNDYYEDMAKKTVIRRLAKFLPMDANIFNDQYKLDEIQEAFDREITNEPTTPLATESNGPSSKLDAIESEFKETWQEKFIKQINATTTLEQLEKLTSSEEYKRNKGLNIPEIQKAIKQKLKSLENKDLFLESSNPSEPPAHLFLEETPNTK